MTIIYHVQYIGFKYDNTKTIYSLNVYDEAEPKIQKKIEAIEKKIIKALSNKKHFKYFIRNIID